MVGHWSREISAAYIQDMQNPALPPPAPQDPAGAGGAAVSRAAALQARRAFRYAANRMRRFTAGNMPPGQCDVCGWHTNWEQDEELQPRVQCFYCTRLVCERWCSVPEHLVCRECHPDGRVPPGPAVMPKRVPLLATADACSSCGRTAVFLESLGVPGASSAGGAGSPAGAAAGRQTLRPCVRCNRWLCCDCRQLQAPTVCVVCPASHAVELPSLRRVDSAPLQSDIERLREVADQATQERGRGRLSSGQYTHQAGISGRARRVLEGAGKRPRLDD